MPFRYYSLLFMARKASPDDHKENGHEEDSQKRCGKHAPMTPVPTAFCAPLPAPWLITSGMTPRTKASEVIRIGRRRILDASSVASMMPLPSFSIRSLANSTIRMAFLADKPIVVSKTHPK